MRGGAQPEPEPAPREVVLQTEDLKFKSAVGLTPNEMRKSRGKWFNGEMKVCDDGVFILTPSPGTKKCHPVLVALHEEEATKEMEYNMIHCNLRDLGACESVLRQERMKRAKDMKLKRMVRDSDQQVGVVFMGTKAEDFHSYIFKGASEILETLVDDMLEMGEKAALLKAQQSNSSPWDAEYKGYKITLSITDTCFIIRAGGEEFNFLFNGIKSWGCFENRRRRSGQPEDKEWAIPDNSKIEIFYDLGYRQGMPSRSREKKIVNFIFEMNNIQEMTEFLNGLRKMSSFILEEQRRLRVSHLDFTGDEDIHRVYSRLESKVDPKRAAAIRAEQERERREKERDELQKYIDNDTPGDFLCGISAKLMLDPVVTPAEHSYERTEIERWLETKKREGRVGTCPASRKPLTPEQLNPNRYLKQEIEKYVMEKKEKQTAAATKIAAMQRGRQSRREVQALRGAEAKEPEGTPPGRSSGSSMSSAPPPVIFFVRLEEEGGIGARLDWSFQSRESGYFYLKVEDITEGGALDREEPELRRLLASHRLFIQAINGRLYHQEWGGRDALDALIEALKVRPLSLLFFAIPEGGMLPSPEDTSASLARFDVAGAAEPDSPAETKAVSADDAESWAKGAAPEGDDV